MANYDKQKLRHYIDVVSFAVDDAKLYLHIHPKDKEALDFFHNYNRARKQALSEYGLHFGPLTLAEAECDDEFKWSTQPWPWEMEG